MNTTSTKTESTTIEIFTGYSTEWGHHEPPSFEEILHEAEIVLEDVFRVINGAGAIENFIAIIILYKLRRSDLLAPMPYFLLSQQALFDCLSCLFAILVSFDILHYFDMGNFENYLVCHIWDTDGLVTLFYLYSDYNHVLFTLMIFLSIRYPIYYFTMRKFRFVIMFFFYITLFAYNFPMFYRLTYDPETQ